MAYASSAREILFTGLLIHQRTSSIEPLLAILVAYWCLTIPLSIAVGRLERRLVFAR